MGGGCHDGQFWDALVGQCLSCHRECQKSYVNPRCTSYCESANCKALPGHYYDGLLKKCIRCAEICGRHPAECSQHCKITSHVPELSVPTALEESTILQYSLLALCMVLLVSSLSLALAVLLKGSRAKSSSKDANHNHKCVVQPDREVGQLGGQSGQSYTGFVPNSSRLTERDPSDDSSPTETCICVHCFPDLKTLGQSNNRPQRHSRAALHQAQIQARRPLWTEEILHPSAMEVQEETAVG